MKKENKSAQSLLDQAQKCFAEKNITDALELLNSIEQMPSFNYLDPTIRMKALNIKGLTYFQRREYKPAEEYLLNSLAIAREIGDQRAEYLRYENLSNIYIYQKRYQKGIYYLQESIRVKEANNNFVDIPRNLIQLASLQFGIENNEAGRLALKKASELIKKYEIKDSNTITLLHFNIAMQLKRDRKYTAAIKEYDKSLQHALSFDSHLNALQICNNQGDIYIQMQQWLKAKTKFLECIQYAKITDTNSYIITAQIQLARIALELKDIKECRRIFEDVSASDGDSDGPMLQRDLAEVAVMLHEAEGDHKKALTAYRKYVINYKKLYDNELSRAVLDMQAKYESEKSERELQKANLKQVESELKALRAQMDPHFIFNALSSMRREMLEGNIDNADKYLVRFSKLLRMILDTSRKPLVQLSENIELLHLYIQIENSRQGNRFDYTIVTKGLDPDTIYLPSMILQPLAENAIVHGLNPKKNGRGKLTITFSRTGSALKIKVSDNGVGRQASKSRSKEGHTSHAINIIKETLDLLWAEQNKKPTFFAISDLKTKDDHSNGTEVTVLVPISSQN